MIGTTPQALARARAVVGPALRAAVDRLDPEVRQVAAYHLGFVDTGGHPAQGGGGKAIRPALALVSAEAVGAAAPVAMPGAVAVQLVHDFSLLHDDVMDRDRERRHRPTAWALFGEGPAIVAGDALVVLAHQELLRDGPSSERSRAAQLLGVATQRMIAGQALDLAFESRLDVGVDECLAMMAGKTGALLSCAASIGSVLAGAGEEAVDALGAFGLELGVAFQAVDDLLGIWGAPAVTGKPAANDLRQHKKSLPVVAALSSGTAAGLRLAELLTDGALAEDGVSEAVILVEEAGGRALAAAEAGRRLERARAALDRTALEPAPKAELLEIAAFVAGRDF